MNFKIKQSRGIFLLPNLLTTAALFSGFYSIVAAMKGIFDVAAMAVFVAMVADSLDGRVARLTNTQSAFGAEYDSLADMVNFGLAPALIIYSWSLSSLGKLGWLIAFLYTAATALRLARFNAQAQNEDKLYFQGLSCTAAAGVIAGMVWVGYKYEVTGIMIAIPVAALTLFIGALMVSTVRFNSFKQVDLKGRMPFWKAVAIVLLLAAVAMDPPQVLFAIFLSYAFSGPVLTLWTLRKMRRNKRSAEKK
ncbi:CDP-diacylglycerol--serine O-phosphatidyltransferase [Gammaproteobacteria bacterium SCGC AG-212-F23]|nr:CDP-diacylglycerol--serine O-phosphatidyltransferase [Gammaproteobacteria bacterium SCGC AG-212-F23]